MPYEICVKNCVRNGVDCNEYCTHRAPFVAYPTSMRLAECPTISLLTCIFFHLPYFVCGKKVSLFDFTVRVYVYCQQGLEHRQSAVNVKFLSIATLLQKIFCYACTWEFNFKITKDGSITRCKFIIISSSSSSLREWRALASLAQKKIWHY